VATVTVGVAGGGGAAGAAAGSAGAGAAGVACACAAAPLSAFKRHAAESGKSCDHARDLRARLRSTPDDMGFDSSI
jgi:hypothetical protein